MAQQELYAFNSKSHLFILDLAMSHLRKKNLNKISIT